MMKEEGLIYELRGSADSNRSIGRDNTANLLGRAADSLEEAMRIIAEGIKLGIIPPNAEHFVSRFQLGDLVRARGITGMVSGVCFREAKVFYEVGGIMYESDDVTEPLRIVDGSASNTFNFPPWTDTNFEACTINYVLEPIPGTPLSKFVPLDAAEIDLVGRLRARSGQNDESDWHSAIELEAATTIENLLKRLDALWQEHRWCGKA